MFLVTILLFPSCKYFKGGGLFGGKAKKIEALKAKDDSIRVADSLMKVKKHLDDLASARLDSILKAGAQQNQTDVTMKYNIIVGSFLNHDFAVRYAAKYNSDGFKTSIIRAKGSRFELVSAESFNDYKKALTRLREIRAKEEKNAWLYLNNQPI
jgi:hypothetical protein